MTNLIATYPFAAASAGALYLLMIGLAIPRSRAFLTPLFTHPVPPHQQYMRGFDALRGIAASMVVIGHLWWTTYPIFASTEQWVSLIAYGTKWVSVFAVLSGFLIYRSAISAVKSPEALREYLIRRFFRIYPVYLAGVLFCLALGQYSGNANATPTNYFFADLFMMQTLGWPSGFANPPTWSLYVEVMFYALLPLVLLLVGRKRMVAFCLFMIVAMLFAESQDRFYTLWKYFLFGILASELSPLLSRRMGLTVLVIGFLQFALDFEGPSFDWAAKMGIGLKHYDQQTIGLGIGTALLLAGLPHSAVVGRVLSFLPLQMVGVISYSVYITHFFVIHASFPEIGLFTQAGTPALNEHFSRMAPQPAWVMPLFFFPGCLTWGVVSYLLIERPGMILGRKLVARSRASHLAQAGASQVFKAADAVIPAKTP